MTKPLKLGKPYQPPVVRLGGPDAPYRHTPKAKAEEKRRLEETLNHLGQRLDQPMRRGIRHADAATPLPDVVAQHPTRDAMRALRLWHWQHALAATARREDWRTTPATQAKARQAWAFHMGAVQALNDLFPMGDTAEKDAAEGVKFEALTHLRIPT